MTKLNISIHPSTRSSFSGRDKQHILILDGDLLFTRMLEHQLRQNGFTTTICNSTKDLYDFFTTKSVPDAFILDWHLGNSEPTGLEICIKIKIYCSSPVIMLTAHNDIDAVVASFSAGAEDYIVKPCDIRELTARLKAVLKRNSENGEKGKGTLEIPIDENLRLSFIQEALISSDGTIVNLTPHETGLVEILLSQPDMYIDRAAAFFVLYGYEMDPTNRRIDLLVSRLRKKLSMIEGGYAIKSIRGRGYKFGNML